MKVAHRREFLQAARLKRKRVLRIPTSVRLTLLHVPSAPIFNQPKSACRIGLFYARFEPEWLQKRVAESNVGQPCFFQIDAQSQVIELRAFPPLSLATRAESSVTWNPRARSRAANAPFNS